MKHHERFTGGPRPSKPGRHAKPFRHRPHVQERGPDRERRAAGDNHDAERTDAHGRQDREHQDRERQDHDGEALRHDPRYQDPRRSWDCAVSGHRWVIVADYIKSLSYRRHREGRCLACGREFIEDLTVPPYGNVRHGESAF